MTLQAQALIPAGAAREIARATVDADQVPLPAWLTLENAGEPEVWVEFSASGGTARVVVSRNGQATAIDAPGACVGKPTAARLDRGRIALGLACGAKAGRDSGRPRVFVLLIENDRPLGTWQAVDAATDGPPEGDVALAACSERLLAVWRHHDGSGGIWGRLFDSTGQALSPPVPIAEAGGEPQVACGSQRFLVVWSDRSTVWSRALLADGSLPGSAVRVSGPIEPDEKPAMPVLAMNDGNEAVVVWRAEVSGTLFGRQVDVDGRPGGSEFKITSFTRALRGGYRAAIDRRGQLLVVWQALDLGTLATMGRFFTSDRRLAVEAESRVDRARESSFADIRALSESQFLVTWREGDARSGFVFAARPLPLGSLSAAPLARSEVRCLAERSTLALAHLRPAAAKTSQGISLWAVPSNASGFLYRSLPPGGDAADRGNARGAAAAESEPVPGTPVMPFEVTGRDGSQIVTAPDGGPSAMRWIEPPPDSKRSIASSTAQDVALAGRSCAPAPSRADVQRGAWIARHLRPVGQAPLTGLIVYRGEGIDTFLAELFVLPVDGGLGSGHLASEVRLFCNRRGEPAAVRLRLLDSSCPSGESHACLELARSYGLTWVDGPTATSPTYPTLWLGRPERPELSVEMAPPSGQAPDDTDHAEFCPAAAQWP